MKKSVKLISSVVVLAILCGAYAGVKVYVEKLENTESEEGDAPENIYSVSLNEIESLSFYVDKNKVTFEKDGDQWVKSDDKNFPVKQDVLDDAASVISSVYSQRTIEGVDDLSQYGLDKPANTITVKTDDGEKVFRFGIENTTVNQYYMRMDDNETDVYLIDESVADAFSKTLYDYAEADTFPDISSGDIYNVQVSGGKESYTLKKDDTTGFWNLETGETTEKADSAKASNICSYLSSLEYDSFINYDSDDLTEYGLDKPYAEIMVDYTVEESSEEESKENSDGTSGEDNASEETVENSESDGDEKNLVQKELIIHVGDEGQNDTRYVTVNDSTAVYTISNDDLNSVIEIKKDDLWDMSVCYLSAKQLQSVSIKYNGTENTISVSRETSQNEEGDETETESYMINGDEIDSTKFISFYNKMINMTGAKRLEEEPETNTENAFEASLKAQDGTIMDVKLNMYDANYYTAVTGGKTYLVNKMDVKEIIDAYEALTEE